MYVDKESELFVELTKQQAYELYQLADKLHMRAGVPMDNTYINLWFKTLNVGQSLIAQQVITRDHLPFVMMKSAALFYSIELELTKW